ncbi:MAG: helix-turn-helix transcriptional regulator [Oscillospiraceae bacterium]|nr:helix-turn-helix transcriptional regulator [Oscillospiraceae bacterium]
MGKIILRLDRMMVERKMPLGELADRVGISSVNLSKIKNNRVTAVRFSTLAAICEALDCGVGDILEFVPEPAVPADHSRPAVPADHSRPAVPADHSRPAVPADHSRLPPGKLGGL